MRKSERGGDRVGVIEAQRNRERKIMRDSDRRLRDIEKRGVNKMAGERQESSENENERDKNRQR